MPFVWLRNKSCKVYGQGEAMDVVGGRRVRRQEAVSRRCKRDAARGAWLKKAGKRMIHLYSHAHSCRGKLRLVAYCVTARDVVLRLVE